MDAGGPVDNPGLQAALKFAPLTHGKEMKAGQGGSEGVRGEGGKPQWGSRGEGGIEKCQGGGNEAAVGLGA